MYPKSALFATVPYDLDMLIAQAQTAYYKQWKIAGMQIKFFPLLLSRFIYISQSLCKIPPRAMHYF